MAEYIEREAAKLRIFEYGVRHRDNSSISFACENLERQMNSIPAADVRPVKWIPVTERLPEGEKDVLVWVSIGKAPIVAYDVDSYNEHAKRWVCFENDVTHWMQLPEPPKEE